MSNEFGYRQLKQMGAHDRTVDELKTALWRFINEGGGDVITLGLCVILLAVGGWMLS